MVYSQHSPTSSHLGMQSCIHLWACANARPRGRTRTRTHTCPVWLKEAAMMKSGTLIPGRQTFCMCTCSRCTLSVLGSALTLPPSSSQQSRQCLRLLAGVRQYIVCLLRTAATKIKSEKRKGGGEKTRMEKNMSMEWHKKDHHKYNCTKEPSRLWAKK